MIQKVKKLERDGKKGKDVLDEYLSDYNKDKKTEYKNILELNTDALIQDLIDFISNSAPHSMHD